MAEKLWRGEWVAAFTLDGKRARRVSPLQTTIGARPCEAKVRVVSSTSTGCSGPSPIVDDFAIRWLTERVLKASTVNAHLAALSSLMNYAVEWGQFDTRSRMHPMKVAPPAFDWLRIAEVDALIAAVDDDPKWTAPGNARGFAPARATRLGDLRGATAPDQPEASDDAGCRPNWPGASLGSTLTLSLMATLTVSLSPTLTESLMVTLGRAWVLGAESAGRGAARQLADIRQAPDLINYFEWRCASRQRPEPSKVSLRRGLGSFEHEIPWLDAGNAQARPKDGLKTASKMRGRQPEDSPEALRRFGDGGGLAAVVVDQGVPGIDQGPTRQMRGRDHAQDEETTNITPGDREDCCLQDRCHHWLSAESARCQEGPVGSLRVLAVSAICLLSGPPAVAVASAGRGSGGLGHGDALVAA